jgi:hypothetical protein
LKKIISLVIMFCMIFTFSAVPTLAAILSSVSANIDQSTKIVTILGTISTGAGRQVSLKVINPDGKTENYVGDTISTEGGNFGFTFKLAGNLNGTYTVKAGGEFVPSLVTATFVYTGGEAAAPSVNQPSVPTAPASWTSKLMTKDANGVWQFNTLTLSDQEWNIGKFDFSYAGYKYNDAAFGTGVPDTVITISAVEGEDITKKMNDAINELKLSGGGIVQIPAGEYRIGKDDGSGAAQSPQVIVNTDNVIIRGAGNGATKLIQDKSFKTNDSFSKGAIQLGVNFAWKDASPTSAEAYTTVASDIMTGSTLITAADASAFSVGDFINIRQMQWPEFNQKNFGGLTELLTNNSYALQYIRKITAISGNTFTVDIPMAYDLKPADNTISVYKVNSFFIKNVGLEDLLIDVEANGVITYDAAGKELTNTNTGCAVSFVGVWDGWAKNVTVNNINTIGFAAVYCNEVTFEGCTVNYGRALGGGGAGYGFYMKGQNVLYRNCTAYKVRHGFTTAAPVCNGNVVKNCKSIDLIFPPGFTGEAVDDTHIAFTHAILWDNHYGDASGLFMIYRGTLSAYAYETSGWSVVWNYYNTGRNPNNWNQGTLKVSPADYGYVVAPHGNVKVVDGFERGPSVDGTVETDPSLHVGEFDNKTLYEGVGWDNLAQKSLQTVMYFKRHNIISPATAPRINHVSATEAGISWDAIAGAQGYKVYRSIDGKNYDELAATTDTSYEDSGLVEGTDYYYAIAPTYLYEDGEMSPGVSVKTLVRDFTVSSTFNMNSLRPGEMLSVNTVVTKKQSSINSVLATLVLYDGSGRMVGMDYKSKDMPIGATENFDLGFILPADTANYEAKVFVWDGTDLGTTTMQPLSDVTTLQ